MSLGETDKTDRRTHMGVGTQFVRVEEIALLFGGGGDDHRLQPRALDRSDLTHHLLAIHLRQLQVKQDYGRFVVGVAPWRTPVPNK